ncbi:MAG: hypothetical protein AAGI92_08150 [Pseudomonadota bacterium]
MFPYFSVYSGKTDSNNAPTVSGDWNDPLNSEEQRSFAWIFASFAVVSKLKRKIALSEKSQGMPNQLGDTEAKPAFQK